MDKENGVTAQALQGTGRSPQHSTINEKEVRTTNEQQRIYAYRIVSSYCDNSASCQYPFSCFQSSTGEGPSDYLCQQSKTDLFGDIDVCQR